MDLIDKKMELIKHIMNDEYEKASSLLWDLTRPDANQLPPLSHSEFVMMKDDFVGAVKMYRTRTKLDLRSCKEAVDLARDHWRASNHAR